MPLSKPSQPKFSNQTLSTQPMEPSDFSSHRPFHGVDADHQKAVYSYRASLAIKIKSLGPLWRRNDSAYRRQPNAYSKIRLYNTTGIAFGPSHKAHWKIPGYIRFRAEHNFDLDCPSSLIERIFHCTTMANMGNKNSILALREAAPDSSIDVYLVSTHSTKIGYVDLTSLLHRVTECTVLSASEHGLEQNIMWLVTNQTVIQTSKGIWIFDGVSEGLTRHG